MKTIKINYFAHLYEVTKIKNEEICGDFQTARDCYTFLKEKYHFDFEFNQLKVAVNHRFVSWDELLHDQDQIVFVPPVAGG
jgi:molybdopterin converting factor small subunit